MPRIFISHASADKPIIDIFFDLLQTGCNLGLDDFACTSIDGAGIETGTDFVNWIHKHLIDAQLVIMVVTPNYYASKFCVAEMGATWILEKNVFPMVPPNLPRDIGVVMLGKQTSVIDERGLDDLYDQVNKLFPEIKKSTARWSLKKEEFLAKFRQELENLPKPSMVDQQLLERERERTQEAMSLYSQTQKENNQLREMVKQLEQVKDKEDVERIQHQFLPVNEEYETLIEDVHNELKKFSPIVVRSLYAFINKSPWIPSRETWQECRPEIQKAEDSEWIESASRDEDEFEYFANECHPIFKKFFKKLSLLDKFIEGRMPTEMKNQLQEKNGVLITINNRDYWEEVLFQGHIMD
jgi:hypothetical protein